MTAAATRTSPSSAHRALTGADLSRLRARSRRRPRAVLAVLGLTLLGAMAVRVLLGTYTVTIPDFLRILGGENIPVASFLVMESKLPRAAVAVVAGLAFGAAGATFQSVLRNPLASPDVVGVSLGASFGAVFSMVVLGWAGTPVMLAAAAGGLAVTGTLLAFSGGRGSGSAAHTMILVGIGLGAALSAGIHWLMLRTDVHKAQDALVWISGSTNDVTWRQIAGLAVVVAVLLIGAASFGQIRGWIESQQYRGKDLAEIRGKWSEYVEKRVAAEDQLKRVDMRAPQSGTVHQMTVHTIGGLVTPSEPAMLIVPAAGIMTSAGALLDDLPAIAAGLVLSLLITVPFCGWLMQRLIRRLDRQREDQA